ncbi:MAG: hypothetical protein ABL958_12345 [Bdellovibrionia bacterium]
MKFFKISLILAATVMILWPHFALGLEVEGLQSGSRLERLQTKWHEVKTAVKTWWSGWQEPARAPSSEKTVTNADPVAQPEPILPSVAEQSATPAAENPASQANWAVRERTAKIKEMGKKVDTLNPLKIAKPAKPGDSGLARTKAGVPTFSLFETRKEKTKKGFKEVRIPVTKIPMLDVGSEESVLADDFTVDPVVVSAIEKQKPFEALKTPGLLTEKELRKIMGAAIEIVKGPEKTKLSALEEDQKVTSAKVDKVEYKMLSEKEISVAATRPLSEEELKFLRALILYEQKDKCHIASGLLYDLSDSKTYSAAANFYLGVCLHKMGLFSESIDRLIKAIESSEAEYVDRGIEVLAADLPDEFDIKIAKVFDVVLSKSTVDKETRTRAYHIMAKGALKRGQYETAHSFADKIPAGHRSHPQAQYIMAIAEYATGQGATSLSRLVKLHALLEAKSDSELSPLVSLNLGRVAFQEKKYKDAVKYFTEISKGHPLWIQALTEQAWAQVMATDNEGAIGNMHSVQSPFFNSVYKPETYVIRTIGYLNLCQYPDAYRSLSKLEKEYKPWLMKMQNFAKATTTSKDYYLAMAKYLNSASATEVGGMPFQVIREMGRHRDYLNLQETINHRIEEAEQYGFLKEMIKKDMEKAKWLRSQAQGRMAAADAKIKGSKKDDKLLKDVNQFKQDRTSEQTLIEYYTFQISVFEEGRTSLKKFEDKAKAKLANLKNDLISKAGDVLKKRLVTMTKELENYFDNNEFLRYEVFAGSGENIRHDLAGGEKRVPANAKPTSKDLSWDFDGEFWEDEIGHYKSSLKDNCPKSAQAAQR